MLSTFSLLLCLPSVVLSATVQRPAPGTFEGAPGLSNLIQINETSISPYLSNSSLVIQTTGEGPTARIDFLQSGSNSSDPDCASFEYPDLDEGLLGASEANIQCRANLGEDIPRFSCNEALNSMSTENTRVSWGQRFTHAWQITCPSDIVAPKASVSSTSRTLRAKCRIWPLLVKSGMRRRNWSKDGAPNTGGLIRNVGKVIPFSDHLAIDIQ